MTRRGKRTTPMDPIAQLKTDRAKEKAEGEGAQEAQGAGRTAHGSPSATDDVVADAMAMAGGLLMSVFGRSKKNGRGKLDTALVDIQVLGIADKARKALDAGFKVELLVEKVAGEGCLCPHCACDVKDVPDDPPLEPKSLVDSVHRNLQPFAEASKASRAEAVAELRAKLVDASADDRIHDLGKASYIAKLALRDSWRKIACRPECGGNWGSNCPGCHFAIPEHFKALWKVANLAKEAARQLHFVGDDIDGDNSAAVELAKEIEEAFRVVGIEALDGGDR